MMIPSGVDTSPAEWFRLATEYADKLRKAGVLRLELTGCVMELAPVPEPMPSRAPEPDEYSDPLDDPATYGLRNTVPGFRRTPVDEDV